MAGTVRQINAEVNLKGTASGELKNLNEQLDQSQEGFTSLTDEANKLVTAQTAGANSTSIWSLSFKAFSAFGVVDLLAEMALGAFSYAYSADEASLSTTGWMANAQKFVAGVIEPFVDIIKELVDAFKEFKEWLLNTEEGMRLIYATLIALSPLIGYFLVLGIWTLISATYAWVVANWALIASYAPLVLLWLGIAAVIGFVILVIEDFMTWMEGGESFFGDWFGKWEGWGKAFTDIWGAMKNGAGSSWDWIKQKLGAGWNWLKSLFSNDKATFSETFWAIARNIWDAFFNTWEWLKGLWNGTGTQIKGPIGDAINWIRENLGAAFTWLSETFKNFGETLANDYPEIGQAINSYLIKPLNFVLGIVEKILRVMNLFTSGSMMRDMADGIASLRESTAGFGVDKGARGQLGPIQPTATTAGAPVLTFDGKRASGGSVDAGGTYLVGEEGPEVLQMGTGSGRVISNKQLGGNRYSLSIGEINISVPVGSVRDSIVAQVKEALDLLSRNEFAVEAGLA